jgi:serine phosphatase RsbU (regulator of sigma subunit)
MIHQPLLVALALGCVVAAVVWGRSSLRLERAWRRIVSAAEAPSPADKAEIAESERAAAELARSAYRKEMHTTILYIVVAACAAAGSVRSASAWQLPYVAALIPIALTLRYGPRFLNEAQLQEARSMRVRKAERALEQELEAPRRWASRLAPGDLPTIEGFEVGQVYESGEGLMAGDFYDLYPLAGGRLAVVIGDVAGHGIEPSITAFQVKYLLRVFLRQYRDPAQALEELNIVLSASGRPEEMVSLCAVVIDPREGTMRYSSAGHPAAYLWHDGDVKPLRATGPLLTLDPKGSFTSREYPLDKGSLVLLYTDGLAEARAGEQLFGEERVAGILRRDNGQDAETLCKTLLEAARDFASVPLADDVAILAVRRT